MLTILDIETAQATILRRTAVGAESTPERPLASVERLFGAGVTPPQAVARILAAVRDEGDSALRRWSELLDGAAPAEFRVAPSEMAAAYRALPQSLAAAMGLAAERVRAFHRRQPWPDWRTGELGGVLGQRATPIDRVGVYVPGGTAPLPSSLLMSAIPAQVAGVGRLVVCTPPNPHPTILAAAHLCGINELYQVGGAQAIGAMAYGTESVPRVDKIVGAGNLFVTLAKQQVYGVVGLDGLAGPTETMVIADGTANPAWVAADLLAQAEHDVLASAILLTPDRWLAEAVQVEVGRQLGALSRAAIITESLATRGGAVVTPDLATAAALANDYAPEHLCLAVAEPEALLPLIRHAGGIFVGERSFEVLGDYVAGPSHVMPTGGSARYASPLNVADFYKLTSLIALDGETSASLSALAAELAQIESLTAHAAAARRRADAGPGAAAGPAWCVAELVRPHLRALPAYQPVQPLERHAEQLGHRPEAMVKLDANENPYGPVPAVREALAGLASGHRYPDPASSALRERLAEQHGVPVENLLAGAGADELIDLLLRLLLGPGDALIDCPPTFGMYAFDARLNDARVVSVPRRADFSLDVDGIERACRRERPKLLLVASPNNPDGGLLAAADLERLLALPLAVVVDEAYVEFARPGASYLRRVVGHENLIVLRTFSKWAGLAGLRVGYGAFPTGLMPYLWRIKQPYNVSAAASAAAIAALEQADELETIGQRLIAERERLTAGLGAIQWLRPYPSQANFVLGRVVGRDAAAVRAELARAGVLVRHFDRPGLDDHLRISVGTPAQTDRLLAELARLEER
jgi:histidinol dehydrogenase